MRQSDVTTSIRRFLFAMLVVGMAGIGTELLLIGHVEAVQQQIPLILLALGAATLVGHAVAPQPATVLALRAVMILFVASGLAGIWLHYRGNLEFELEMYLSMSGTELVTKTLTGATPVLAPGSMALLGLIGLTYSYKHPLLYKDAVASRNEEGES